jgi:hypothetical protein
MREVQGSIQIRQHCTFSWRQPESAYQRIVDIENDHCETCIAELVRVGGFIYNDLRDPSRSASG